MSQSRLHSQDYQIVLKRGLAADVNSDATKAVAQEGEPHWTTDAKQLYIFDGEQNVRVPTLNQASALAGDLEFANNNEGPVLVDRGDGKRYRLFVNAGVLGIEEIV